MNGYGVFMVADEEDGMILLAILREIDVYSAFHYTQAGIEVLSRFYQSHQPRHWARS